MKHIYFLLALAAGQAFAASPTSNFSTDLKPIFETLIGAEADSLIGREFTASLTIKRATKQWLVFTDAYIEIDPKNKYQIAKWIFTPEQVANLADKQNSKVNVRFKVDGINKADRTMPYITASILSITPAER